MPSVTNHRQAADELTI